MTISETLAEFLITIRAEDLPERSLELAAMIVASTVASAALGRKIESARIVRDLETERGGRPESSVWFEADLKLPAVGAARVNALMSDAAASDDSDLRNIVHCGTPLTATSLAIAERTGARGIDILAAIVTGYEAAGRIGEAILPGWDQRGHHGCMAATFGATVASARLLGLDAKQTAHAIALTATSIGGLSQAAATSISREYHAGLATMLGIEAALVAERGFTGELSIMEGNRGFVSLIGGPAADATSITRDLGASWDIETDMAFKLVPGGHPYHAISEAAANAAREGDINPETITAIVISRPGFDKLTPPLHPRDLIDMAHSPAYFAAAGAHDKRFGWEHATAPKITDPAIHLLIEKVRIGPQPIANAADYRQGATVTIETTSGQSHSSMVLVPRGAACLNVGWSDIEAKYRALVPQAPLAAASVESSLAIIRNLRAMENPTELLEHFR